MSSKIRAVRGLQILDSRGNPTVEVEVRLDSGAVGRAAVPSGASTGRFEAVELRDGDKNVYGGKGVAKAVEHVNGELACGAGRPRPRGSAGLDELMIELDGTDNKARLGANAILGCSLAAARAAAVDAGVSLYRWLGGDGASVLPVPMLNVVNGGAHAANSLDLQEFMVVPAGAETFSEGLRIGVEVFHALKALLHERGPRDGGRRRGRLRARPPVERGGDRGGSRGGGARRASRPDRDRARPGDDRALGRRRLPLRGPRARRRRNGRLLGRSRRALSDRVDRGRARRGRVGRLGRADRPRSGSKVQLVGDDLFVTNVDRLAARNRVQGAGNAILVKVNQIGTLTETLDAIELARANGFAAVMSHRSGETEDTTIADLAVATGVGQIKTGAPSRSDRVAKYNQLLRIEAELGDRAVYPGWSAFPRAGK